MIDFLSQYSLDIEPYPFQGGAPSRWQIFEDCLASFDVDQQKRIISDLLVYDGPMKHGQPDAADAEKLRSWLGDGPSPLTTPPEASVSLNWNYVNRAWHQAAERISKDPSAAITSARTVLESVCLHILDSRGVGHENDGDLQKLYRTTSRTLKLSPDQQAEDIFRQVLGGCATIANGLAGMRNQFGDAHGRGPRDSEALTRHARLAVNSAFTLALFLIETHLAKD